MMGRSETWICMTPYSVVIFHVLPRAELVHRVDHGDDMVDWSFRQDAMAEIENMSGFAGGAAGEFLRLGS